MLTKRAVGMEQATPRDWLQASNWENENNNLFRRRVNPEQYHILQGTSFTRRRLTPWSELLAAYWANTEQNHGTYQRSTSRDDENADDAVELDGWNMPSDTDSGGPKCRKDFQKVMRLRIGTEFWGFLSLPIEIRRLVYEDLLFLGKIFVPVKYEGVHGNEFREPLEQLLDARGEPYYRYRDYENFRVRNSTGSANRRMAYSCKNRLPKR